MIDLNFLDVKFTGITLLHILILLGIPYIILYLFHRKTKFDNFPEKWELGIFIFTLGGIIVLSSLFIQSFFKINFYLNYLYGILLLSYVLFFISKKYYNKEEKQDYRWVLIELKNGDKFKGVLEIKDKYHIILRRDSKNAIQKIYPNENKKLKWKSIYFNYQEVLGIYFLHSIH